ncbi:MULTISPECIES: hypothetical protein [Shewanella]|jgi:hypothetical protein|uniref:hypothetical protein n=2 Tax=Shewanellaceae TaxID=267890 RepID=UPI00200FA911|nr:hypothetical protein [Shewanella basaltis]MCL1112785.1 hypothetical protein [Shewanella basaltis]
MNKYVAVGAGVLGLLAFNAVADDSDDVRPGSSTIAVKWEHKILEGRTDKPKVEFAHRMRNGFQFGIEQVWLYDRSVPEIEAGYAPEQYEMNFKTDYKWTWGNKKHQAGPVLDYQIKEDSKNIRVGAYYGYRLTKNISTKVRARYSTNLDRIRIGDGERDDINKEMRYDFWLTYRWDAFTFVWDAILLQKLSSNLNSSGVEQHIFDNNKQTAWEHEFSAEYRMPEAREHAFYGKFKLKQALRKASHTEEKNGGYDWYGKHDNAIEIGYKYRF